MTFSLSLDALNESRWNRRLSWMILLAYLALVLTGAWNHESWFDEAQSWLLARDSSVRSLLFERLHYEGHPPLWHLLIMPFAKLGLPYRLFPVFSALLAAIGVAILVFHPRIPILWKAAVPFGFFLAFQYAVVARSYVLIFPLLMGLIWIWPDRVQKLRTFMSLLILLSLVSLHGLSLAGGLVAYSFWDPSVRPHWRQLRRSQWLELSLVTIGLLAFLVLILAPPGDLSFGNRVHFHPSPWDLLYQGINHLTSAVAGGFIWGILLLLPVLWWLRQRRHLALALILQAAIFPICAIYWNVWHEGILVLTLLFPLLLAAQVKPLLEKPRSRRLSQTGAAALALLTAIQFAGTYRAYEWDLHQAYSGSRRIATLLQQPVARGERIAAFGFSSLAVQPYFKHNIYANYRLPDEGAYWSWRRPTPLYYALSAEIVPAAMEAWTKAQLAEKPEWVVVSLKFRSEITYLNALKADGNYIQAASAPGLMIWKQEPEEFEQFMLFHREAQALPTKGG
jgi:hypothetical protein